MNQKFILGGAALLAASQLISRALGVLRDHIFAQIFGATGGADIFQLDLYYAAFRLPDLVYNLLIFGALSAAFVPLLTEKTNEAETSKFASNTLNVLLIGVFAVSIGVFLLAEPLTRLITPGFTTEQIALTAQLLRIQLLAPLFFTCSAVFGGLAQYFHKFTWYALAPVFYNLGIILSAIFWGAKFGVFALAWGTAAGAGLHAAIQLPGIWRSQFRWQPIFRPRDFLNLLKLSAPRVLSVGASQLQFVAITIFASLIGTGALAIFNYAWNLASLPLGVVGVAYATVSFAALSRVAHNFQEFFPLLQRNVLGILFWAVPAAVGLFFLREEIVRLILAGGEFHETDIWLVTDALALLSPAIPFFTLQPLLNNAFFARKNTRIPLFTGLLALLVTILAAKFLITDYFSNGLATAFALAGMLQAGILLWLLRQKLLLPILIPLSKILLTSVLLGWLTFEIAEFWSATSFWALVLKILVSSVLGAGLYLGVNYRLGLDPRKL